MLQKGFHYLPEGLALIKRIASQMNNNRLGRPKIITENECNLLHTEIDKFLLENPSNYEYIEGRTYIKSLNRFRTEGLGVELVGFSFNKTIASFNSITECALVDLWLLKEFVQIIGLGKFSFLALFTGS